MLLPPAEVWQLASLTRLVKHHAGFMGADELFAPTQQHRAHNRRTCPARSIIIRAGQACITA